MLIDVAAIVVVTLAWGSYPLLARSAGLGGPLGSLLLMIFGFVPVVLAVVLRGDFATPSRAAFGKVAGAGILMGIGLVAFNHVANSRIEASTSIPIVDAGMLVVSTAGAIWLFGESVPPQKLCGIVLLVAGIALLRPS